MRTIAIVVLVGLAACSGHPSGASGDVSTYRGNDARTGRMPGPGPSGTPDVIWHFQAAGRIESSPAVVGGVVYLVSEDGVVHALELASGSELWSVDLEAEAGAASPLVADSKVFVGDQAGVLHALDRTTGTEGWRLQSDGAIGGSAAWSDGLVLTATDQGSVYAVEGTSGHVRWQTTVSGPVTRSIAVDRATAYVPVSGGWLVAIHISDGSILWNQQVGASGEGGTPAVAGDLVFDAVGIEALDPAAMAVVALDAATGASRWRYASPDQAEVYTPAVVAGRAYIVGLDERVVALDATTGSQVWTVTTGAPNEALPAIVDGTVYVATNGGTLQALDAGTGSERWRASIQGVPYAPIVTGGLVLVGTSVGLLYAIGGAR
jgi:outer membrane protein assembly factor BamB